MGAWSKAAAIALTVAFVAMASPAHAANGDLQPGDPIVEGDDAVVCTLGFALQGEGLDWSRRFFATAAHCVDGVGDRVKVRGFGEIGTVVLQGDPATVGTDFALVEVDREHHDQIDPAVRGHPTVPIGIAREDTAHTGELVGLYGWGDGFEHTQPTRSERQGLVVEHDEDRVRAEIPITFGDSGGPWFTENGLALALTKGLQASVACCSTPDVSVHAHGPTIQNVVDTAAENGYTIDIDHV